jgi:leucine dehydrogenase
VKELLSSWNGLGVVTRFDAETGTWMFIALHDDRLGAASGGTRMRVYERPEDGLLDAMRLAEGMTYKWAALEMPVGGGKAVLAVPELLAGEARQGLLRRYGRLIESLRGTFSTGEDLGTTPVDMAVVGEATRHVHLHPNAEGEPLDPGPFTALGVAAGLRAALGAATGSEDPEGRSILVQGTGNVGSPLARELAGQGADLLVSDVDRARAEALATEIGAEVVAPEAALSTPCDVLAPCAIGGVLDAETISRLECRVVAGSANNQLATPEDADRLHRAGILYAPDYVINGGGALTFGLLALGRAEAGEELLELVERRVGDRLRAIFAEAAERDESPAHTADRQARRVLEQGLPDSFR